MTSKNLTPTLSEIITLNISGFRNFSQSNLYVMLKLLPFYKFCNFFCRLHLNYATLHLLKLKKGNFYSVKHSLKLMSFDAVKVIKQHTFQYLMKSVPIPRNQSVFEILQLFDTQR